MNIELTPDDIRLLMTVIDISSQRGVFRGSELSAVGHIYEKLTAMSQQEKPTE